MTAGEPIHVPELMGELKDPWEPHVLTRFDRYHCFLVRLEGEYYRHYHDRDELFYVLEGEVEVLYEDGETVHLRPGDLYVVPHSRVHRTRSQGGAVMLVCEAQDIEYRAVE